MLFGRTKLELKVGIFVFIGLVILTVFILLIGDFKTWVSGYNRINFTFNFVNGIKVGAPVRFSGVNIGEVKDIKFLFLAEENRVQVQVIGGVRKDVKIPADSTVWVNTLGLLGEKYIEIMPGKDYSKYLASEESIAGTDPIAMHEIGNIAKNIVANIDETILEIKNSKGTFGRLVNDDSLYKEIEALITDLRRHPWKLFFKTKEKREKK